MGKVKPVITVVIPTFNSEATIQKCLESVVSQSYNNIEIIVVDGLSTDDTVLLVNKILSLHKDTSQRLISETDYGIYDAMNKGIKLAKGEWVYFLGSDDYLINEYVLERFVKLKDNDACDFIYGDVIAPDYGGRYDGPFDEKKIVSKNICHQAIFFRKTLFEQLGMYKSKYPLLADYEFNIRCIFNKKVKKKYIDLVIAFYAPAGSSKTRVDQQFLSDKNDIIFENVYRTSSLVKRLGMQVRRTKEFIRNRINKK